MDPITAKFRSALNGFNRSDVVQFIQQLTTEHAQEIRILEQQNAKLKQELEESRAAGMILQNALNDAMNNMVVSEHSEPSTAPEEVSFPLDMADDSLESAANAAPEAEAASEAPAAPGISDEEIEAYRQQELEAYRRAEEVERIARIRAAASGQRVKEVYANADAELQKNAQELTALTSSINENFLRLQELLSAAQTVFDESSGTLKAASELGQI